MLILFCSLLDCDDRNYVSNWRQCTLCYLLNSLLYSIQLYLDTSYKKVHTVRHLQDSAGLGTMGQIQRSSHEANHTAQVFRYLYHQESTNHSVSPTGLMFERQKRPYIPSIYDTKRADDGGESTVECV